MEKISAPTREQIREQFKVNLKEALAAKGQRRWDLLGEFALEHGYKREDAYSYRYGKNYLIYIAKRIAYAEELENNSYEIIRELLERKWKIQTNPSIIANALTIGGTTLGGAIFGVFLIKVGLHPFVLIPSIIIPPVACIYDMLRQGAQESAKLAKIDESLKDFKEGIYYEDEAVRRFYYQFYKGALLGLYKK